MVDQDKLSEVEWRRRMVAEAAANLAQHAFVQNDGDGTQSYKVEIEHIEQLRTALIRLKKVAPSELADYEPPSDD